MASAAWISVALERLERTGMRMMRKCICRSVLRVAADVNTWSLLSKRLRFVPKISGETEPLLVGGMPPVIAGLVGAVPGLPMGLPAEGDLFHLAQPPMPSRKAATAIMRISAGIRKRFGKFPFPGCRNIDELLHFLRCCPGIHQVTPNNPTMNF